MATRLCFCCSASLRPTSLTNGFMEIGRELGDESSCVSSHCLHPRADLVLHPWCEVEEAE